LPTSPLLGLVRATHPLPAVAVTAFFSATALAAGLSGSRTALLAAAVLCGQLSVGWCNDAIDAPLDIRAARPDKPIAIGQVSRRVVAIAAGTALVADVPLSLALGWRPGVAHLVAVGSAWSYDLGLKRTVASILPYAVSFGLVPVIVAATLPGSPRARVALIGAGVACGIAAHFANTVGDTEEDALTGVRGLPQRIGPRRSTLVAGAMVVVAGVLVLVAVGARPLPIVALAADVVLAAALPAVLRVPGSRRLAFRLVLVAVAVLVVTFVVAGGSHLTAS
jgi:4-hydroxybenzoate polyprenyltransferase